MSYVPNLVNKLSVESYDPAADEVKDIKIGGDPIDTVYITLSMDAVTDLPTLLQYAEVLNRVTISDKGNPVKEFTTSADLLFMAAIRARQSYNVNNHENTDPSNAFLRIPIMFGRYEYDPDLAYPVRDDQDLILSLDVDVVDVNVDNPQIGVDVLYKGNFASKGWVKETTKTITSVATGDFPVVVPNEGKLLGIGLFSTTVPENAADTTTLNWVRFLRNNKAWWYTQAFWEWLQAGNQVRLPDAGMQFGHFHEEVVLPADTRAMENDIGAFRQYAYMDFDPLDNMLLAPDVSRDAQVGLVVNYGDTAAARMIPVSVLPPV